MSMLSTPVSRDVDEIGPYQVLEDLGSAPFGSLYLVVDSRSDQKAMLKVIPPSRPGVLREVAPWEILLAETRSLFRIYHRGIPPLVDLSDQAGSLLVAFTPVEGPTLRELLALGERPDRAQLIDWGCQLLGILAEAHAEGIVHRHVSEDQIVVAPDGHLVLTGLGLTQLFFEPLTPCPPEHLLGEPFTPQTDLYAVGLLLRRLIFASGLKGSGVATGAGRDPLLKLLARATFPPDPAMRFQDATEMAEALRQAGGAAPVPVRPVQAAAEPISRPAGPQEPSEDGDRRSALLLVAAVLLLMLSVIAAGWLLVGRTGMPSGSSPPAAGASSKLLKTAKH